MPSAPSRFCAGGCGAVGVFPRGRCPQCATALEQRRGSATQRGYGARDWRPFRRVFIAMLVALGIDPVCGAALPGGPQTGDSTCRSLGLLTFSSDDGTDLHLDHEPPLRDFERSDPSAVCDPYRIQLLCRACHSRKTQGEQAVGRP